MIFNSVTFIVFLLLVVPAYWLLPKTPRLWLLFLCSLVFYGFWRFDFLGIMLFSAAIDYFTAIAIAETPPEQRTRRRMLLAITLVLNLGILFFFKYLTFCTTNVNSLLSVIGSEATLPLYNIILPFGISFYTFETISYTIDVYRGILKPERRFIQYALFVTFFPKLVAGPIQRASELLCQLRDRKEFEWEYIVTGVRRILYGLAIKVFLADNIGGLVDDGFALDPHQLSAIDVSTLAFLFGFQIYFDFSAYSHIALGAAKLMGIDIPENFNFPYIATSFKEFWKRWHISLSAWIRDYLYLPLAGATVTTASAKQGIGNSLSDSDSNRRTWALFGTWAIMGFWHGANWTFLLWGLIHATFIFAERMISRSNITLPWGLHQVVAHFATLTLAMLSWIPFRAADLTQTFAMLGAFVDPARMLKMNLRENNYLLAAVVLVAFYAAYFYHHRVKFALEQVPWLASPLRIVGYATLMVITITFLRPISQFIYFQF